jgi:hypothetical protein
MIAPKASKAMVKPDQLELLIAAAAGAVLGIVTAYSLGHEGLGILTWALMGAVVVGGVVYCVKFFR